MLATTPSRHLSLFGLSILSFAELIPIANKEDLLELKSLIESSYTDGISAIKSASLDENDNIVGVFEDAVSPRLTKRYRFTLTDTGLRYKMVNPGDVDNFADAMEFTEQEYFNFARSKMFGGSKKKKDCPKGTRCGFSCIQKGLECDSDKSPEEQKRIRTLKNKARAEAKKAGTFVPKRQQIAEKKAKEAAEAKTKQDAIGKKEKTKSTKSKTVNATLTSTDRATTAQEREDYAAKRNKGALEFSKKLLEKIPSSPPPYAEEINALRIYTGTSFKDINDHLRKGTKISEKLQEEIKFASAALKNLPAYEGTVYRATLLPKDVVKKYVAGQTLVEKGFTSTSIKAYMADIFTKKGEDNSVKVTYVINSKRGRAVSDFSKVKEEEEVLFAPNSKFDVLSVKKKRKNGLSEYTIFMDDANTADFAQSKAALIAQMEKKFEEDLAKENALPPDQQAKAMPEGKTNFPIGLPD